jgi:hypothetical protein
MSGRGYRTRGFNLLGMPGRRLEPPCPCECQANDGASLARYPFARFEACSSIPMSAGTKSAATAMATVDDEELPHRSTPSLRMLSRIGRVIRRCDRRRLLL